MEKSKQVPVLVDFTADWCAPCRVMGPILNRLSQTTGQFVVATVDTDEQQKLAGRYGIRGLPTFKLFRHGEVVAEKSGVQAESVLRNLIEDHC